MKIRFISCHLFLRCTELDSASHISNNLCLNNELQNRVQGEVQSMIHFGHSK